MVGKSVLTEVILRPSFLVLGMWDCCNDWGSADEQQLIKLQQIRSFVHMSLPHVSALGSRLELPLLTDQSLIQ